MEDKTAVENLRRLENANTRVTCAYAVNAIENLGKVRAWAEKHSEGHSPKLMDVLEELREQVETLAKIREAYAVFQNADNISVTQAAGGFVFNVGKLLEPKP